MKKTFKGILAALLSAALLATPALAEESSAPDTPEAPSQEGADIGVTPEEGAPNASFDSTVYLPNGLRAVFITPGTDFSAAGFAGDGSESLEDGQLDDTARDEQLAESSGDEGLSPIFSRIKEYGMNAVVINTTGENGERIYSIDEGGALSDAIFDAHSAGLYAYITLDVADFTNLVRENGGGLKDGFSAAVHKFAMNYACDGILLTNYYSADDREAYAEYLTSGSGIGYTNWLYETNEYICRTISEVIHKTNSSTAVGFLIEDMWANSATNEQGSQTLDSVQALYDGFCDTKGYTEKSYADFLMVKAYGTTSSNTLNFEKVVSWWSGLAENSGAKLYILHLNERVGVYDGWYEDQLLRQLTVMEDYPVGGSAFNSLSALDRNLLGSTTTLLKYFENAINTDTIFEDLTMISPTALDFVTYDSTVKFMGTFDSNFEVYFDGNKIQLNEAGNFFIQKELKVGANSFTITHKGKTYKYSIERRIDVLKSIENGKNLTVPGGSRIALVAVAYSGAKVTATVGGKVITLTEKSGSSDGLDANGSYAKFIGYYTAPAGIIGKAQQLGSIVFSASYSGYSENMTGGSVTVEAEPEPPKEDIKVEIEPDQSSVGTGQVVGRIEPIVPSTANVTYVKVLNNYTNVYDAQTTGSIPSPAFSQMPAGTLDYYRTASDGYVLTTSGKRYKSSDVTTFNDTGLGYNALFVKEVGNSGGKSYIKMHLDYKASFNVTVPMDYYDTYDGPYGVSSFNATQIYITFDNVTSVTSLPSFKYCSLFSSGKWETVTINGVPKFRLVLTLRQQGIYSGIGAYYDTNGDLMLTFHVPTASLAGKVIVIDPGHGYGTVENWFDPGAIGNVTEQSVNLAVAKKLADKLTAMGATAVRLKTESELIPTPTRPTVARSYNADMFIALHCNSALSTTAHGVEAYYFTPYSQPLAKYITDGLSDYFDNTVYKDGTQSNRMEKYSYYWVTLQQDFPSILVEMGFISNERECMVLANGAHQDRIAQIIADGVKAYFARSTLDYSGNGNESAEDPGEESKPEDDPPAPPTPPPADSSDSSEVTPPDDSSDSSEPESSSSEPEPDDSSSEDTSASSDTTERESNE